MKTRLLTYPRSPAGMNRSTRTGFRAVNALTPVYNLPFFGMPDGLCSMDASGMKLSSTPRNR